MRGEREGFFRTFGDCFKFHSYRELSERDPGQSAKYFLKLMILATILMFLAAIPAFMNFSRNVDKVIGNFDTLKITINATPQGPIILFPDDKSREITIDWASNATGIAQGNYLIAKDRLIKKTFFGSQYTNLTGYSNVLEHKETYKAILNIGLAFLIPSMAVGAYVFFGIKFFIMIVVLASVGFIVSRTIRFDIEYKNCFNSAVYASTIGILIAMMAFPYNIRIPYFRVEWIGYALSIIYFISALKSSGYFEKKHDREREMEHRSRFLHLKE